MYSKRLSRTHSSDTLTSSTGTQRRVPTSLIMVMLFYSKHPGLVLIFCPMMENSSIQAMFRTLWAPCALIMDLVLFVGYALLHLLATDVVTDILDVVLQPIQNGRVLV